jgi:RiboL-PSP-HEPN
MTAPASTYMHAHVGSTAARWAELDVLLSLANQGGISTSSHDALCRATIVMIVAHFEGFIKDTIRALIDDINSHSTFTKVPKQAQRIHCRLYTGSDQDGTGKISKEENERELALISLFESLNAKLAHGPFVGGTSNPKPSIISRLCRQFGVDDLFYLLENSDLDSVFSSSLATIEGKVLALETMLLSGVSSYPYNISKSSIGITNTGSRPNKKTETLWETFVNNLLAQRHTIAHGSSLENSKSTQELRELASSARTLALATALVLCSI